jgi:hypothetical protein
MVTGLTYRDKPFDRLSPDPPGIFFVVDFRGSPSTIDTLPVVSFQNHITLSLPVLRLEINIAVIVSPPNAFLVENPVSENRFKPENGCGNNKYEK